MHVTRLLSVVTQYRVDTGWIW